MSNPAYSKTHPKSHRPVRARAQQIEEPEDLEEEEYIDGEGEEERTGLFGTPARAMTMVGSVLLLLLVFGSIAWILGQQNGGGTSSAALVSAPRVGALAPDFNLVDVKTNKPVALSSLRGKPVWINFWGTWCPPCKAEMPEMQKIYNQVGDKVTILGISMGPRDEPAGVKQFVELNNYTWTFIHDSDSSVMTTYQVTGIPTSFFIDKSGVIRAIHVGGADAPTLQANLQQVLN